uniref:Uncharacterized protein n=1 Tax=Ixodes ricinus TaxID=34613 RepID=A0A6B0TZH3_IXORI
MSGSLPTTRPVDSALLATSAWLKSIALVAAGVLGNVCSIGAAACLQAADKKRKKKRKPLTHLIFTDSCPLRSAAPAQFGCSVGCGR